MTDTTHRHVDRQFYGRDKVSTKPGQAKDCSSCRPQEWVEQLLRQYLVPADSGVVMANIHELARTLIDEFFLDEWFDTWESPPEWVT